MRRPGISARKPAGSRRQSRHGRTGFVVPQADPRAIADAAGRLLGDPALRRRMGDAARATATARFSAIAQSRLLEDALLAVSDRCDGMTEITPAAGPAALRAL